MFNKIYTITTLQRTTHPENDARLVGWFSKLEDALKHMEWEHPEGIAEAGWYQYAVIEAIDEGIFGFTLEEIWYEYVDKKWKKILKPERFNRIIGFWS